MINPSEWNTNYNLNLSKEVSFEECEMILEDWMIKGSREDNTLLEEEMQLEDWMMKTDWAVYSLSEKEIEFENGCKNLQA